MTRESDQDVQNRALILFDGDCGFCQFWIQFILKRDIHAYFYFAPLPSKNDLSTIVLREGERRFEKSEAVLRIASRLQMPWPLLVIFRLIPQRVRDAVYDEIAKRRHHLMKSKSCLILTDHERARFINPPGRL